MAGVSDEDYRVNDNKKICAPKLAITKPMVDAGKELMASMLESVESHTDDALVAGIFFRMWEVYWTEIQSVARKKATIHPLIQPSKSKLIMPPGIN